MSFNKMMSFLLLAVFPTAFTVVHGLTIEVLDLQLIQEGFDGNVKSGCCEMTCGEVGGRYNTSNKNMRYNKAEGIRRDTIKIKLTVQGKLRR